MEDKKERNAKLAQEIYDTVRNLVNDKNLEETLPEDKIHGCVLIWFPTNHAETNAVATTALGGICLMHLLMTVEKIAEMTSQEANPLAS